MPGYPWPWGSTTLHSRLLPSRDRAELQSPTDYRNPTIAPRPPPLCPSFLPELSARALCPSPLPSPGSPPFYPGILEAGRGRARAPKSVRLYQPCSYIVKNPRFVTDWQHPNVSRSHSLLDLEADDLHGSIDPPPGIISVHGPFLADVRYYVMEASAKPRF